MYVCLTMAAWSSKYKMTLGRCIITERAAFQWLECRAGRILGVQSSLAFICEHVVVHSLHKEPLNLAI